MRRATRVDLASDTNVEKDGEATLSVGDLFSNGTFGASITVQPEVWSACVGDDGEVPLIRLQTTISLEAEEEGAVGTVGEADAELEDAVSVHFAATWRECE